MTSCPSAGNEISNKIICDERILEESESSWESVEFLVSKRVQIKFFWGYSIIKSLLIQCLQQREIQKKCQRDIKPNHMLIMYVYMCIMF